MTSSKQQAANQKNGLRSEGPKTAEGKAVSRMNSLSHGLTAESITVPGESDEEATEYIERLIADLDPLGALQEELAREVAVRSVASAKSATRRGRSIQALAPRRAA